MRGDKIGSKPKWFSISSDLFPYNQLPAVPCRLWRNRERVSREKWADWKPRGGAPGPRTELWQTAGRFQAPHWVPAPSAVGRGAASDNSTCPCLVCLPRVSESHSVVSHVIAPISSPWCLLPLGAGITGLHQLRTVRVGAENQTVERLGKRMNDSQKKAVTHSNQFVWKILSPTAVVLSRFETLHRGNCL